ncbi:MAG: HAMP domain-containing protein, partial [Thermodesulfobacteriota bacterium]|nr:HAMP domain-containing protein [Thermodesulfobacteriota bacterium]
MSKIIDLDIVKTLRQNFGIKVFAAFTVFLFFISFSFTTFLIYQLRESLTDTLTRNGELLARVLAHNSRIGVFAENDEMLRDPIEAVFHQQEVLEVSIFNLSGDLLIRQERPGTGTSEEPAKGDGGSNNEIFEKLKGHGPPFYIEGKGEFEFWSPIVSGSSYLMEEALFFEERPLQRKDRIIGFVKVKVGKAALSRELKGLLLKSILVGVVLLMTGSGVVYVLVKGITGPLDRLTEGVKAFGLKGVIEKVPVETVDEIGRLAAAFNNLSESLKTRETEKEQLETQLRHAQKMEAIGTLAGGIAHDFNNILGVIMGYTELAFLDVPKGTLVRRRLEEVMKASNRAKDLVMQILTFSRHSEKELKPL